jgi:hypothetical protein
LYFSLPLVGWTIFGAGSSKAGEATTEWTEGRIVWPSIFNRQNAVGASGLALWLGKEYR